MRTSVTLLAFASFALLCASVSSSECRWEPIRLSFASVRGGQQSAAPPQLSQESSCGGERTRLTCSQGQYPDDIVCNTGLLREHFAWEGRSRIIGIEVNYDHETVKDSHCQLNLIAEGSDGTTFRFSGAECSTDIPDEMVPRFWMSKVTSLKITLNSDGRMHGGQTCFRKDFILSRAEVQEAQNDRLGSPPLPVKFILNSYRCENTAPTFVGGRIRTVSSTYTHDGRRYRPKRM